MPKPRHVGKLPPRYQFILNPYADTRVSGCPRCRRLTHPRKLPLFIHVEGWGAMILGKTGPYCSPCELIVVHQDELEMELAIAFGKLNPAVIGNGYLVVGTVEKRFWKTGVAGAATTLEELLQRMADFSGPSGFQHGQLVLDVTQPAGLLRPQTLLPVENGRCLA